MANDTKTNFEEVKTRLDEIVDAVSDEEISLDSALDLYEEAIALGMQVSSLLEEDIAAEEVKKAVEAMDSEHSDQALEEIAATEDVKNTHTIDELATTESAGNSDASDQDEYALAEGVRHE